MDATHARRISPYLLEIDGADHRLSSPGPLTNPIVVLGRLVTAMLRAGASHVRSRW